MVLDEKEIAMNIQQILMEYDAMFGQHTLEEIEQYLIKSIENAKQEPDLYALVTLYNEMIGFSRDTSQKEKGLAYCEQLMTLMSELKLHGSVEYATSLLNIANAFRAFGKHQESMQYYEEVEKIYKEKLAKNDFSFASLYNNISLLYQEMGQYEKAKEALEKALSIVVQYEQASIEQATTRTNLATTLLRLYYEQHREAYYQQAEKHLEEAYAIHEKDGKENYHFSGVLAALGDAKEIKGVYQEAADYYQKAMQELEKHVGKNHQYMRVKQKYESAIKCEKQQFEKLQSEKLQSEKIKSEKQQFENRTRKEVQDDESNIARNMSHLDICREFYEKYGKPMIQEHFSSYQNKIAVGMVGEGSDCFGFEDEISKDHDYGIGFCMWVTEETYKEIGTKLQEQYECIVKAYEEQEKRKTSVSQRLQQRRGVCTINVFYESILGVPRNYEKQGFSTELFAMIEEFKLATAVNGAVFDDEEGIFSKLRSQIQDYYDDVNWRARIAQNLHDFAQYAQSNYPRMMARKDQTTALLCRAKGVESAMNLVYLLNRVYAPYYKWKRKGLEQLLKLTQVSQLLDAIAQMESQTQVWNQLEYQADIVYTEDKVTEAFERVAKIIVQQMKQDGLTQKDDSFLENHIQVIMGEQKMDYVMEIVKLEWQQFDQVKNEGGRADCQDDWNTFSIMRKSQYLAWPKELQESFLRDLQAAQQKGWNLITEKYARMMESTAPHKYQELESSLPKLSEERIAIQEEIIKVQVAWMESFAEKYPHMAGNARSIHTSEDNPYNTSYETYLRGELGTYSEQTFILYGRFITELYKQEKNLAYEIMENTAKLYGYQSLEDAERKLEKSVQFCKNVDLFDN